MTDKRRLSIYLEPDVNDKAEQLGQTAQLPISKIINRAINTEYYIQEAVKSGSKVMLHRPDGSLIEVVFR